MPADAARARYIADAVATATPARLIVLLYDRLWLDIQRAQAAQDCADPASRGHLQHAQQIVAELLGSLDQEWTGAGNLASVYAYLLRELMNEMLEPEPGRLAGITKIVFDLRTTWQQAEAQLVSDREAVRVG